MNVASSVAKSLIQTSALQLRLKFKRSDLCRVITVSNALDRKIPLADSRAANAGGGIERAGAAALPQILVVARHRFDGCRVCAFGLCVATIHPVRRGSAGRF